LKAISQKSIQIQTATLADEIESVVKVMSEIFAKSSTVISDAELQHLDFSIGIDGSGKIGLIGCDLSSSVRTSIVVRLTKRSEAIK
jgi:hypothetical protein